MPPSLFARWRSERELTQKTAAFVGKLTLEPSAEDVAWLAEAATKGDVDHAQWELRYARRALGLIAAQRDTLDDRTASLVANELSAAFDRDARVAAGMRETAQRQFNARLSAYRDGLEARGGAPTRTRMGQTLIAFAGGTFKGDDPTVLRAGDLLEQYLAEASEALRANFGTAVLPENLPPSAVAGH